MLSVLLDPTQPQVEQLYVQPALQDSIVRTAPAKLHVLQIARHHHLHTTSRAAPVMQATADRMAETAAFVVPVPIAQGPQTVLDQH